MSNLPEQLDETICVRALFQRGQKILVAVSGGVDSMVLLHVLHELSKKNKWRLTVAHLNHQLRGRSSDADERLVKHTAKKMRLPIVITRADVKNLARRGKLSLEMAARKARHEFLAQTAARLKISHIALAHHADDQVELFFLRLLRGSGSEGLAGIKWRGASPANPKIQLVRPLLEQSKEALRDYATAHKIRFREDASNEWLDIQRNLIRRELLPLLQRKYQPALQKTILRVMDILKAESELVGEIAEAWTSGTGVSPVRSDTHRRDACATTFAKWPVAIQRRALQAQLLQHGIPVDFALVERLRTSPGQPFTIFPEVTAECDAQGRLRIHSLRRIETRGRGFTFTTPKLHPLPGGESPGEGGGKYKSFHENLERTPPPHVGGYGVSTEKDRASSRRLLLKGRAGAVIFAGRKIAWTIGRQKTFCRPQPQLGREVFDADKVGLRIVLRHWQPGDRFQPIGMDKPIKLQDLFVNQKIPRARRHDLIVATTAGNEVFWVESLRISERFKLTPQTTRQLTWQWQVGENTRLRVSAHHVRLPQLKNVRRKQNK